MKRAQRTFSVLDLDLHLTEHLLILESISSLAGLRQNLEYTPHYSDSRSALAYLSSRYRCTNAHQIFALLKHVQHSQPIGNPHREREIPKLNKILSIRRNPHRNITRIY